MPIPLDEVEAALRLAQDAFALIVVDSASLEELPQSAALARVCDGTIIVLDMRRTARQQAAGACEAVRRLGGQVIGATINRHRRNVPRWLDPIL
jgi:Mrp family chromosome partitioning ATPase